MENNLVKYTVVADVHVDAIPIENFKKEKVIFLDHISKNRQDVIFVAGDYYHSKIAPNSPYMKEAMKFFAEISKICKENKTKLRFIRGTESHDNDQLDILAAMDIALDIDMRIINKVEEEELFPGFTVLYLPEEYLNDMDSYYHKYFSQKDKYSMIIGHGLIDKAAFIAHVQESEETRASAPIFQVKKLHEICMGPIYFGHIHTHMLLNRFRYVSSFSRYAHGEESAKGFMGGVYDIEKQDFMDLFIENTLARKYTTVKIKDDSELFNYEPQYIVNKAMESANEVLKDFVRIEIDIPESYEKSNLLVAMLNESVRNKRIKLKILTTQKEKMVAQIKEKVNEEMVKYSIIFDKNVKAEEKLSAYIKIKNGVHIPVEEIEDILYS